MSLISSYPYLRVPPPPEVDRKLLFDQLPLLEIDGLQLVQSQAMVAEAARELVAMGPRTAESDVCGVKTYTSFSHLCYGLPGSGLWKVTLSAENKMSRPLELFQIFRACLGVSGSD